MFKMFKIIKKKEKIKYLEKQIKELDTQYEYNVTLPYKEQTGISLPDYIILKTNLDKEYIPKKIELEVRLRLLKGVD